jgi:hypothetical protein
MADSTILNLDLQATGANAGTWGTVTNENLQKIEKGIKGYKAVDVAGSGTTSLTVSSGTAGASDEQSRASLKFTGTLTGNMAVECEAVETWYFIDDSSNRGAGPYTLSFGPAGGTAVSLMATTGAKYIIYTDGSTAFDVLADAGNVTANGTLTAGGNVSFDTGTFVFNTSKGDYDARFAGDTETNLLFVDAGTDRVGVKTGSPQADLEVAGTFKVTGNSDFDGGTFTFNDSQADLDFRIEGDGQEFLFMVDASTDRVGINTETPTADFNVEGAVVFNDDGGDKNFRVEGDTDENLFISDASADKIGIGVATPASGKLEVNQTSTTAAISCINLDQDDEDAEFLYFDGTSAADSSTNISSATTTTGSKVGAIRVSIGGTARWIRFYDTAE